NFFNAGFGISLNDAGKVAFRAVNNSPPSPQVPALFVGSGTSAPSKVVAQGDAGPGGVGTVSLVPFRYQMNNAGQVAYVAGLNANPAPEGVFLATAGGARVPVALVGDAAPGTSGGTFSDFRETDIELNNTGRLAFWSRVAGPGAGTGFFLGSATSAPTARLLEGQPLPGGGTAGAVVAGGNNFIGDFFTLADSGEVGVAVLNVNGAPNLTRIVIAAPDGTLRLFAMTDESAHGTGSLFSGFMNPIVANSAGEFFFNGALVGGPARWGIFSEK
ncbi:MAG: hypothetical protein LC802_22705, partial [Acidobacteria bacterium]|nr:hypothetical protein [Acidobacteriota bacterium]